ncbi:MAG: phage tail sheath subtilisin-like domain-containing protein [Treponema sp.]|nr:phage tail sheath subtilisin-like domain-containing protein [Treponema sp.]
MAIPFTEIPASLLVPGQYQEIDNSLAGSVSDVKRALMIGTMAASGTATAGKAVQVRSADKAKKLFGNGSPAAVMAAEFLSHNTTEELYVLPIAETTAGTKWNRSFVIAAANAQEGSVAIAINATELSAAVSEGASANDVASAITAAINGAENCPVEAEVVTDSESNRISVKLTSVVKGVTGNYNTIEITSGAVGVSVTAQNAVEGTLSPEIEQPLKNLGSVRYHYMACDFTDARNLKALANELNDRYTAMRQIDGRCFIALSGEIGDVSTENTLLYAAQSINCPHIISVSRGNAPQHPAFWAAAWCAVLSRRLADDPAANTTDTAIDDLMADEFSFDDRQALLAAGISTYRVDTSGTVLVERVVTSYTENSDGARDTSYLDMQVVETISAIRTYINQLARKRFKTWKLARTDENFGAGSKVMTPAVWRSFLAEVYQSVFIQEKQWCQDFESYKDSIIVEVKSDSKTRLEYRHRPVLIGQFYVGAGLNQFM